PLHHRGVDERLARELVHLADQLSNRSTGHEVRTVPCELLDRRWGAGQRAPGDHQSAASGQVWILFGTRKGELALEDPSVQQEPGVLVARTNDVFERPQ